MKIYTLMLGIMLSVASPLIIFGCGNSLPNTNSPKNQAGKNAKNDFPKIELPPEMPADTQMKYSENGGMSPAYKSVRIFGNQIIVEEVTMKVREKQIRTAEISQDDQNEFYQTFVVNKFNLIKNDECGEIVYDAGSSGINISFDKKVYGVQYGDNFPLSGENAKHWSNIRAAFEQIEAKYKDKLELKTENFAVINYEAESHRYIFDGINRPANLSDSEIENIEKLVSEAVETNNSKQKEYGKIEDLKEYKFQYIPVYNSKKEKEVWVNAFCNGYDIDWKKQIIEVDGGGSCFFNLMINLRTSNVYDFLVNAPK